MADERVRGSGDVVNMLHGAKEANVKVRVLIDEDGEIVKCTLDEENSHYLSNASHDECMDEFLEAACDAADDMEFRGALLNCRPIRFWVTIPIRFKLR